MVLDDGTTTWLDVEPGTAGGAAGLPEPDALPAAGRAGRRHRRLGGAVAGRTVQCGGAGAARRRGRWRRRSSRRCRGRSSPPGPCRPGRRRGTTSAALPGGGYARRMTYGVRPARPARQRWPTWSPRSACRWPGCGRSRRCGWPTAGPGSGSTPTTGRCRPRSAGSATPCTWTRGATAGRRRWPGCTTSAARRAGWSCCTSTASPPTTCPRPGTPVTTAEGRPVGFVGHRRAPLRARPGRARRGQAERAGRRPAAGRLQRPPSIRPAIAPPLAPIMTWMS